MCSELLTRKLPYHHMTNIPPWEVRNIVCGGERPLLPDSEQLTGAEQQFVTLMEACWQVDPVKRPTFAEILAQLEEIASFPE